jgi:hypothetical protein
MDPAPRAFDDLPRDPGSGLPVPFACGTVDFGGPRDGTAPTAAVLDHRRVTQCALSRVCGVCGAGLGRPIAFLGSAGERDRNAFHFPPSHLACARALLTAYDGRPGPLLGHDTAPESWVLVTTAGFEFVRPERGDRDQRSTFQPNSLLDPDVAITG